MDHVKDLSLIEKSMSTEDLELRRIIVKRERPSGRPIRLSDVFSHTPYGHVIKGETGMGATTLELNAERNSIIVQPLKVTASAKATKHKGTLYVGSTTDEQEGATNEQIKTYCNDASIKHKKLLVVADSLPKLHKILGKKMYDDYFLMIDEIDSFQLDAGFREKMERCIDIYKLFPMRSRALVSATEIDFSDPELQSEYRTEIVYKDYLPRKINIVHTNDVKATGYEFIVSLLKARPKDKIMIAYNSVAGCRTIADKLVSANILPMEDIKIMCSTGSQQEVGNYRFDFIGERLPAQLCFFTAAYFSGFDLYDDYHLVSLSENTNRIHSLSEKKLKQIAGRSRKPLWSETVIHDTVPYHDQIKLTVTREELISAAEREIVALKCIEKNFTLNPLLGESLKTIREFIVKHTTKDGFQLVRETANPLNRYAISYFNIDAYLEHVRVRRELYQYPTELYEFLRQWTNHEVTFAQIDDSVKIDDKATTKGTREEIVKESITIIRESDAAVLKTRRISKDVSRTEKNLIGLYLDHCQYIDTEQLLAGLEKYGCYPDARKTNKFVQAMFYESLEASHPFKRAVQAHLEVKKRYTNKELLARWNQVIAEASMHKMLTSSLSAVRLTKVYFSCSRQKEKDEQKKKRDGVYLLKSDNPYKLTVIQPRKTANESQLANLIKA